jgi:hypothetical protein
MIFILLSYSVVSNANSEDLNLSNSIPRVVLIELFVQATCTTCPHAEFCLEELAWEYGPEKIILLEEHLWDDGYDIPETNARYDWYVGEGAKGTPDAFINGLTNRIQGLACECGDTDKNYLYYKKTIDSELARLSYLELSASKIVDDSSIFIEGKVKNISNITLENLVVCGMVYKEGNDLGLCCWVQDILPSEDIPQLLPGEVYTYNITSEAFPQEENDEVPIHVVVFVQDIKSPTKEVLQALYVQ